MAGGAAATGRAEVRALLARRGLAASRRRGQNFLVDAQVAEAIAEAAGLAPEDAVIEIGPGLGILTRALAARARRVVAIEIDAGLVRALGEEGGLPAHVELLHADALALDLRALAAQLGPEVRVVANLPYAISTPLLRRLLAARDRLRGWLVLVQREVALRLLGRPGSPDYGALAVLHALVAPVERVREVPAHCFHPVPKVTSSLVRVVPRAPDPLRRPDGTDALETVERVVRAAFGQRRKMLVNALRAGLEPAPDQETLHGILDRLGIDRRARAEALAPGQLLELALSLGG
jgi:16S rRNA (adenine1518-N6/adenine1519-N6)-dimethyltransferase